ncbi:unnamed protein product [Protopolystoma xenopodis]|uniref:DNA 3'-5' helicase n=1 Tax=Protopolystoma xenopodis TaxID=117903 RepID=A0A3S4ZUF7_9PLAT|nr:unnamed protein product [Protopolystoma xenopodis]
MSSARVAISHSPELSLHYGRSDGFPWHIEVKNLLTRIFRLPSFRPLQIIAINATLDKRDVILVMPTGAGKSLVYQLPAMVTLEANGKMVGSRFSLVITPLVSLMYDQLISLKRLDLPADTVAIMNATTSQAEQKRILDLMVQKPVRHY